MAVALRLEGLVAACFDARGGRGDFAAAADRPGAGLQDEPG